MYIRWMQAFFGLCNSLVDCLEWEVGEGTAKERACERIIMDKYNTLGNPQIYKSIGLLYNKRDIRLSFYGDVYSELRDRNGILQSHRSSLRGDWANEGFIRIGAMPCKVICGCTWHNLYTGEKQEIIQWANNHNLPLEVFKSYKTKEYNTMPH
jgi:hypothetical protein